MDTEEAKVVKIKKGTAILQMEASNECQTCSARHACSTLSGGAIRQIEIPIANLDNLKEGEKISLSFQPKIRILSAFLIFILPLLLLILGYFVGLNFSGSENMAILTSFAGLAFAFIFLYLLNKILVKDKNFIPRVSKKKEA